MNQETINSRRRQRGRAVDVLAGVISLGLFTTFTWWWLTLAAESVPGVI